MAEKFTEETGIEVFNGRKELNIQADISLTESNSQIVTTLDPKDEIAMFNAMSDADFSINDHIGKQMTLCGYFIHDVDMTDKKTGEVVKCPRVLLIDENGKTYGCVSWGIYRALVRVVKTTGNQGPWKPGIRVEFAQRKGKDNNTSLTFKRV